MNTNGKKASRAILIPNKVDLKARGITRDEEKTFPSDNRINLPGRYKNSKFVCSS